jgi:hypothetical protein
MAEAAVNVVKSGGKVQLDIMVPLVSRRRALGTKPGGGGVGTKEHIAGQTLYVWGEGSC